MSNSSAEWRRAIRLVIEYLLLESGKSKKQLALDVFQTRWTATLQRRLYERVEWSVAELDAVASWFGITLTELISEAQFWLPLDNESNTVVG
jgi:hypothetical protein